MRGEFCTGHAARRGVRGEFCTARAASAGVLGEFCTARAASAGVLGEFCPEAARCGCCWANNVVLWCSPCASWRAMAAPWRCSRALRPGSPGPRRSPRRWWGFCSMRSWLAACRRRVAPLHGAIPPIGGGVAAVRGGVTPTLQTTSVKNADNGLLVAKWSAFWAHQCLAVVRCSHVNPLLRVLTRTIARKPAMWSVGRAAQARMSGLTCGLEGPRADWRVNVREQPDASRGPTLVSG